MLPKISAGCSSTGSDNILFYLAHYHPVTRPGKLGQQKGARRDHHSLLLFAHSSLQCRFGYNGNSATHVSSQFIASTALELTLPLGVSLFISEGGLRQVKYLNNVVEQDHQLIKPGMGFFSTHITAI